MQDVNEYKYEGVTYVAKAQNTCEGCAFLHKYKMCQPGICSSGLRSDGTSVIFVEKPKLNKEIEKANKVQEMQETKQYDASDKSKEYWEIISDAYQKQDAEVYILDKKEWETAWGIDPSDSLDWFTYDWRIKPKNRTVTFEIPEDLHFDTAITPHYNGSQELLFRCYGEKETLQKIVEAFEKS